MTNKTAFLEKLATTIFIAGTSAVIGLNVGKLNVTMSKRYIPEVKEVSQGCVAPADMKFRLEDLDNNGKKESVLTIDGSDYLLMYDNNQRPTLRPYEIEPAKIEVK